MKESIPQGLKHLLSLQPMRPKAEAVGYLEAKATAGSYGMTTRKARASANEGSSLWSEWKDNRATAGMVNRR